MPATVQVFCCGGSVPELNFTDETMCERLPRVVLPRLILNPVFKAVLGLIFIAYIGFALYGFSNIEMGMKYLDLVLKTSHYYKFSEWDMECFGQRLALAFTVNEQVNYLGEGKNYMNLSWSGYINLNVLV